MSEPSLTSTPSGLAASAGSALWTADPLDFAPVAVVEEWHRLREAVARGDFDAALEAVEIAAPLAQESPPLRDRLTCARAGILPYLGQEIPVQELRAILMRSTNATNQHLSAFQIAQHFENAKQPKKGIFYARMAVDSASAIGNDHWLAYAKSQLGNLFVAESRFAEALGLYREALVLQSGKDDVWTARIKDNVGYCKTVLGDPRGGALELYASLRRLRQLGVERYEISALLDLSFTLLELGRPSHALRHAARALLLADRFGDTEASQNALYLQGESARALGRVFEARRAFDRLARSSGHPDLTDFLLATNARALLNLKA